MSVAIEPYTIAIPDVVLDRILTRVRAFDWAGFPDAGGWSAGISVDVMRRICDRWVNGYDWRALERHLNRLPQFLASIDGQIIHFVHERGKGTSPWPILLSHGWPGSILEFDACVEPLADPASSGGDTDDAFDVVVPSLPGYGFSGRPARPIGPRTIAGYYGRLMAGLGYDDYMAQGGDWGSGVAAWLAYDHADACRALHLNMVMVRSCSAELRTPDERQWHDAFMQRRERERAYSVQQQTRPQTLSFAMMDSPVGAAAWILEKFGVWSDLPKGDDGGPDLFARYREDELINNVMLYLVTGSFATAAWLYKGFLDNGDIYFPHGSGVDVPTAFAGFRDPYVGYPPRSWVEQSYPIVRWSEMPRGGHFAAAEAPDLFIEDLRAFARSIR